MSYYNIPKDLIEDVHTQTGGNYENTNLVDLYKEATMDLLDLVITIKLNINEILKNPGKYKTDETTKDLLNEIMEYKNKKSE